MVCGSISFVCSLIMKNIWRCRGRLDNADIPDSSKYPILIDAKRHVIALIVKACHEKVLHGGVKSTLTELRSRYWAVKGKESREEDSSSLCDI